MVEALRAKHTKNKKNMYRQSRLTLILPLIVLFAGGCKKWLKDEELTLNRQPYNSNELRTDGYYYHAGEKAIIVVFFYRDGTMIQAGSIPVQEISNREEMFKNGEFYNHIKNNKTCWCVYCIENGIITTNYWVSPKPFQCYFQEGTILNDTTFVIQSYYRMENGEKIGETEIDETYHFHQFSPKPDSTNIFIP